jgi:hypothetical protein
MAQCKANGRTFPFNALYFTTSWVGAARQKGRRLSLPDGSEADVYAGVEDPDHADDFEGYPSIHLDQRQRGLKGSKGGNFR